jgi:pimeloyl-ACP methyl ester carboxylesterase
MLVLRSLSIVCFLVISGFISLCAQPSADQKLDPDVFDRFLGTYRFSSGDVIVIGRSQRRLYSYEPATGLARGLDRSAASKSDLSWVAGPAFQVFSPIESRLNFIRKNNQIEALMVSVSGGQSRLAKKLHLYNEEKLTFQSGDARLAGTLLIPRTEGPHPAVVFVHGSGEQDRNGFVSLIRFVADHFARHGIATFSYDKRGVGGSTGNWASQTLDDLAADALAALKMLQERKDIDRKRIGLWGGSQAAWIMPKMTVGTKDIAFIVSVSGAGAGISVGDQVLYNLEIDFRNAGFTNDEILEWKKAYRILFGLVQAGPTASTKELDNLVRKLQQNPKLTDDLRKNWFLARPNPKIDWQRRDQWFFLYDPNFDARKLWQNYPGPVLGVFGELDGLDPVSEVAPIFTQVLSARKNTDFTITVFPKAHHILMQMETDTPNDNELPNLKRYVPGYFDTMSDWILRHVTHK